jgi:hypothetical protein
MPKRPKKQEDDEDDEDVPDTYIIKRGDDLPVVHLRPFQNFYLGVREITKGKRTGELEPIKKQGNTCFIYTALQAICWAAHEGPLEYMLHHWYTISDNGKTAKCELFISLLETILLKPEHETPNIYAVHDAIFNLSQNGPFKIDNDVIQEKPEHQDFQDANEVFLWIVTNIRSFAGTVVSYYNVSD